MRKPWLWIVGGLIVFAIAGCGLGVTQNIQLPQQAQATSIPLEKSQVVTLAPAKTSPPAAPTTEGAPEVYPYPAPEHAATVQSAYPAPEEQTPIATLPEETPSGSPAAGNGLPWKACEQAPGWVGCDPKAPFALKGRVAFVDANLPAFIVLDLQSGEGWSVNRKPLRMEWSPLGDRLLVTLDDGSYADYEASGTLIEQFNSEIEPRWQADDSLSRDGLVRSLIGGEAWLKQAENGTWQLRVMKNPADTIATFALETQSADSLYELVSWVPGASQVLGQFYVAGNSAMMQGGQLFLMNVETGERTDLKAFAPLGWNAAFAWNPTSSMLAFTETGSTEGGIPVLALLDFATGQITYPLPAGVQVSGLSWQPSGEGLAFAALPFKEVAGYANAAIYYLRPGDSQAQALTKPQPGAVDGVPHWLDNDTLLYARRIKTGVLEIHALNVKLEQDITLVSGLPVGCEVGDVCDWQAWIALGSQP